MQSTISIIMSVLNGEQTIDKAISSILEQSYQNIELIVCDDASTDKTWHKLELWKSNDARITLIRNSQTIGLAASLNRCLEVAQGEWIGRQDADDISAPDRLQKMLEYIKKNNLPYAGCGVRIIDDDGEWSRRVYPEKINKHDIVKANPFFHPTLLFRRDVIEAVTGYRVASETARTEDYDLIMRMAAKGFIGQNIQEYLYDVYENREEYANKHKRITRWNELKTRFYGYQEMKVPFFDYIYLAKPLLLCLIPLSLLSKLKKLQWK